MRTKFSGLLALILVLVVQMTFAQEKAITGVITDQDGLPLPGANVVVKGTSTGTQTDFDGNYTIQANAGDVLVYSFVGQQTEERTVGASNSINVTLEQDAQALDEVVVTALGISRKKKALGYAATEVAGEELNKLQQTDAISALSGRVSGVQISQSSNMGGSKRILIRGANSITQNNQPLFVVDGIPMDNSNYNGGGTASGGGGVDYGNVLNDLNPDEIEDITVLRGPAAALYGSRAANGVVLVTTKNAKKGSKGVSVDVSSSVSFNDVAIIPDLQRKYGGGAIVSDADGGVNGFQQVDHNGQTYLAPQYQVDESWGPRYNPNVQVVHWDGFNENGTVETRPWVAPKNDVEDFWETGFTTTNSVGVNKTGEDYGVRFAYKNTNIDGAMPNSSQLKNDFRITANAQLSEKLSVNGSLNYTRTDSQGRPTLGYSDNSVGQKFFQWGQRQLDYERLKAYKTSTGEQRVWNRNSFSDPTPKYSDNPYWTAYENYTDDVRNRFFGSASFSYEIIDNLTFRGSAYGDYFNFSIRERTAVGSQSTSSYYEAVRENSEYNFEGTLSYSKDLGDFGVSGMAGMNKMKRRFDLLRGQSSGGLVVPEVYNLKNSADAPLMNDITTEKTINSVFGQLAFDFRDLLFVEATYRTDWSSSLPEDNNKYSYPSVSASFLFSELIDAPWLSLGKVRAGWAEVGNDTDPYNVYSTYVYNTSGSFMSTPRLFKDDELLNENLKAETTRSKEVGLDLALFNNRVDISATYFDNRTFDQIMPLQVSQATGYNTKFINAGEMSNKGIEIGVNLVPVRTEDFEWAINVNYTKVDNKLEELYGDLEALDIQAAPFGGVTLRASVGDTYGMLWGNDFLYDDQGNKVIQDNGQYAVNPDLTPLGSVLPDYTMGISNSIRYKNFDMSFLFDIRKGGHFYSLTHMWGTYSGMLAETAGVNDQGNEIRDPVADDGGIKLDGVTGTVTWNEDGTYTVTDTAPNETYVSGSSWAANHYHGFGTPSAQSVFKSDYIKLRELTLGYNLPTEMFNNLVKSARISAYGRNLLTFGLDKEGFDPEMAANGSGNVQGLEGGLQPIFRTYGVNLKLTF
ncbi:SusC/RagA family TonB-linked outer membrane protein [Galbibacter sp. EGI 63066]|uniref:SusC/RagA family TonB-linked outer membrane protein n=1 Tax=Galbibacter sp. EGI 63066 TaxID=2993559 RepID=UPI002248D1F1|nr:SusC/RagA family TonB-linked outer membrane protein [Galbibacter sp. EGI 63066]MCX2679497.1 SusC/RagA family TonB-linked outer membrane protein [Galbibacter sp. EGI 63066]